jgi:hypothetical protein
MKLTVLILASLFSAYASAGVHKCTDAEGKTVYRSGSCSEGQSNVEINVKTGTSTNLSEKENQAALSQAEQEKKSAQEKLEQEQLLAKQNKLKQDASDESTKNQFLIKNNPIQFSAFAIPPYQADKLPDLVQNFQSRLPDIERFRRQAAQKALASGQCGRVEASEMSSKSSKNALVFSVDCSSGKNFNFNEQDLAQ